VRLLDGFFKLDTLAFNLKKYAGLLLAKRSA
jgi:hypothetical protein